MESFALHSPSLVTGATTGVTSSSSSSRISIHYLRSRSHIFPKPITALRSTSSIKASKFSLQKPFLFPSLPSKPSDKNPLKFIPRGISASASLPPKEDAPAPLPAVPQGAKLIPLVISVSVGLIIRFLVPKPLEVTPQAWQLFSIFLSTIAGLVLGPLPVGAWAFLGLTTAILTRTLSFATAFSAFTNEVIWLIVISFFFARGFVKTGLGDRIATYFVKWLGKSTLGLSYGLTLSEALIAPAMPSTTARAGGVFLPIIKSLSLSAGSKPGDPSAKKLGSYLVQSQFQVCIFFSI